MAITMTGTTGTWTPDSATYTDGTCTVRYVPSELPAGNYSFTIEVKSGANEFNVGPYTFTVKPNS